MPAWVSYMPSEQAAGCQRFHRIHDSSATHLLLFRLWWPDRRRLHKAGDASVCGIAHIQRFPELVKLHLQQQSRSISHGIVTCMHSHAGMLPQHMLKALLCLTAH